MVSKNLASRYQILRYVVYFRWTIIYVLPLFIYFSSRSGIGQYTRYIFILFFFGTAYNVACHFWLKYNPLDKVKEVALDRVAFFQIILDQLFFTGVIYFTGGIDSLAFLYYFLTIFVAVSLFTELVVILLAVFAALQYIGLIVLEFYQIIPHFDRYTFASQFYLDANVTFQNTLTVVFILLLTTFLAALISRLMVQKAEAVEQEEDKVKYILNNLLDGIVLLDQNKQIIFHNHALEKYFNFKPKFIADLLSTKEVDAGIKVLKEFLESERIVFPEENYILEVDQPKNKIIQGISMPLYDNFGRELGWLKILQDVTREKEVDKIKSDFISIAAHQLRTPLSYLKWLFKMLISGDLGRVSPMQKDILEKGLLNSQKLIELVNDLLNISEIEEGAYAFKFKKISLNNLIQEMVEELEPLAGEKKVALNFTPDTSVSDLRIDVFKFKIALNNIITNAIIYNHPEGKVEITLAQQQKAVILKIKDTGIGIPKKDAASLFNKFFRSKKAQDLNTGGSGLGLYISKNIIDGHGGKITYQSKEGEGTTFIITIPIVQPIASEQRQKMRKKEEVEKIINYL